MAVAEHTRAVSRVAMVCPFVRYVALTVEVTKFLSILFLGIQRGKFILVIIPNSML